jgi:hypothetical protein
VLKSKLVFSLIRREKEIMMICVYVFVTFLERSFFFFVCLLLVLFVFLFNTYKKKKDEYCYTRVLLGFIMIILSITSHLNSVDILDMYRDESKDNGDCMMTDICI